MITQVDTLALVPIGLFVLIASAMIVVDVIGKRQYRLLWTLSACLIALVFYIPQASMQGTGFSNHLFVDGFTWMFGSIILVAGILVFLLGSNQLKAQRCVETIDVDLLLLLSLAGALITVSAANFVLLFVGVELMSIPLYVLAGIARTERSSAEAALKYFILGAFSSAFLL